jgi:hypothetical protein
MILTARWQLITEQLRHADLSDGQHWRPLLALGLACMADFQQVPQPGPPLVAAGGEWCRMLWESPLPLLDASQVQEMTEGVLWRGEALADLGGTPDLWLDLGRLQVLLGECAWNAEWDALALEYARRAQRHLAELPSDHEPTRRQLLLACDLAARASGRLGWTAEELSHLSWAWSLATDAEREKLAPRLPAFVAPGTRQAP